MHTRNILFSLFLLATLLPACAPYKMDIRQGNFVTPEMRSQLKVGMTRAQVKYAVGTPMISDPFHANRWDYVYRLEHDRKLVEQQSMTLYFEGDNLVRIEDRNPPLENVSAKTDEPAKE